MNSGRNHERGGRSSYQVDGHDYSDEYSGERRRRSAPEMGRSGLSAADIFDDLETSSNRRAERRRQAVAGYERNRTGGRREAAKMTGVKAMALGLAGLILGSGIVGGAWYLRNREVMPEPEEPPAAVGQMEYGEREQLSFPVDYYILDEAGGRIDRSEDLARDADLSAGVNAVFHAGVDTQGRYDDLSLKESTGAFGPALSGYELVGDFEQMKAEYLGNYADRLARQPGLLAEQFAAYDHYLADSGIQFTNTPEGVNQLARMLEGISVDEYQDALDMVLDVLQDEYDGNQVASSTVRSGTRYITKNMQERADGTVETVVQRNCSHVGDFEVVFSLDDEGNRECNFGQEKLNILQSHGLIGPEVTLAEAERSGALDRYDVLGMRLRCGGQWVIVERGVTAAPVSTPAPVREQPPARPNNPTPVPTTPPPEQAPEPEQTQEEEEPDDPEPETTPTPKTNHNIDSGGDNADQTETAVVEEETQVVSHEEDNDGSAHAAEAPIVTDPTARQNAIVGLGGGETPAPAPAEITQEITPSDAQTGGAQSPGAIEQEQGDQRGTGVRETLSDADLAAIFEAGGLGR